MIITFVEFNARVTTFAVLVSITIADVFTIQFPTMPIGADVSTRKVSAITTAPADPVVIVPPLPPNCPPLALSIPAIVVEMVDHILIEPPLPTFAADTSTMAPAATFTVCAWMGDPAGFAEDVPILIVPPPCVPVAVVIELAFKLIWFPTKVIVPPTPASAVFKLLVLPDELTGAVVTGELEVLCEFEVCTT